MSLPPEPSTEPVRLTQYSHGAGCGCKIAPAVLETILKSDLGTFPDPRLLVGYGTRLGSGCTSGHGVCGLSRRSPRSIAATVVFMLTGFAAVYLLRHVLV